MYKLTEIAAPQSSIDDVLTLPYADRQKSRMPARTDKGVEIGLVLPRGQILRSGLVLTGQEGFNVLIKASVELLSVLRCEDSLVFARACYHLGNRHVALQILQSELRYLSDYVLDHMLEGLGLHVTHENLPFEPELGAYHVHDH